MISSRRHAAPLAIAIATGAVVAGGGCNFVVGSGDYKVSTTGDSGVIANTDAEATGDGATKPPPGDDGGTPPGSDGGTPPDTGAPPPPVDSGTTTDGGMPVPVCGSNGTVLPDGLPTNDPAFQQLVKSCTLAVSCDPLFFDVTISDCITKDYLQGYEPSDCLSKISSCDDYFACQGSRIATATECQQASDQFVDIGACNGTTAISCFSDGEGIVSNCAALGGSCTVFNESDYANTGDTLAGCQLGECTNPDGFTHCGSTTQVYSCDETDTTSNVEISRTVCPQGSTCQTINGLATCLPTTSSCATAGSSCTGGDLTQCLSLGAGNQQYTSNCSVAGLQCTQGLGTGACTAAGCSASNCTEGCDPTKNQLTVCIGGAPFVVDCPSLGLPTCNGGSNANSDQYYFCSYQ
jgi:hypothetical protein